MEQKIEKIMDYDGMASGQDESYDFHHKKFMVIMKAGQEMMEACLEKTELQNTEEIKSIVEYQKVPIEN
jgi:hypothetical protein